MIFACVLIFLGALIHGVALSNPFYFDDVFVIRENAWLHGVTPPKGWFGSLWVDSHHLFAGFRPLLMLSFYLNRFLFGESPASFRLVNIALHILNSLWVAILFRQLYSSKNGSRLSWIVGLFFLLHPIQTLGINFLWKRSTLFETTFVLTQLILHVHARQQGRYRNSLAGGQILLFTAALFVKESALLIPSYLFLVDWLFFDWRVIWQRRDARLLYLSFLSLGVAFYFFRFDFIPSKLAGERFVLPNWHSWDWWNYLMVSLGVIPRYVGLWLMPAPRLIDDPRPLIDFPWGDAIATSLLFILSILTSIRFWTTTKWVAFASCLFWIYLLPQTSIFPLYFPMDQARLYFPLAGLCGLVAIILKGAARRAPRFLSPKWIFPMVIATYGSHSFFQHRQYSVPAKIWQDVVLEYENSDLAWASLGQELAASNLYRSAAIAFLMASRCEDRNSGYHILAYHNMLREGVPLELIKQWLSQTMMRNLSLPDTVNLAVLLRELEETEAARFVLVDLLKRFPNYAPAHLQLAAISEVLGDNVTALQEYERTLKLMPSDQEAKNGIVRLMKKKRQ